METKNDVCPTYSDFLAYLVPLDVDVTGNITAQILKLGVILNFFAPWLSWQRSPFLILSPRYV
jgi:hypothetical protein